MIWTKVEKENVNRGKILKGWSYAFGYGGFGTGGFGGVIVTPTWTKNEREETNWT